jgi:hypothetical protein
MPAPQEPILSLENRRIQFGETRLVSQETDLDTKKVAKKNDFQFGKA